MAALWRRWWIAGCVVMVASTAANVAAGQEIPGSHSVSPLAPVLSPAGGAQLNTSADSAPLTLQAAVAQARVNSQQLQSALIAAQLATEDKVQARAALLPGVTGLLQHIYTQPNGTPSGVFISNDGPHVSNAW